VTGTVAPDLANGHGMTISKDITRIILVGIGVTSLASLIYLAGPLIAIGDYRPFESVVVRDISIVLLIAGVAAFGGLKFYRRKQSAKALAAGVSADENKESDEIVLKDKMKDAVATLKSTSGGKKDYLYDLPWYLLIGPPGSGKTTALINSGLKFPLLRGAAPAAIAGVGGTRYCDWWFTEEAVLIDTAGRYTTQDSDVKADKQSWFGFLALLKKNRPRQPINGVIVVISLEDLMILSSAELSGHSNAIRARLLELHERLKVDFPVYALFTKGDLVAGFMEYFNYLNERGRKQVWGATFQTADKSRNMVSEVGVEYDALLERLSEETLDRLQDEPVPNSRVLLFGFPVQMARLKQSIHNFLTQIFEPTRYHANATLRGFYITSGTQQGTPIDQLIGALVKSFGAEEVPASSYSGQGKSFFLHDLIMKVIIGEAAWVSTDRAAVRRAMMLKVAAFSVLALLFIAISVTWLTSYTRNSALIEQTELADKKYLADAGPYAKETLIGDRELHKVLPLLQELRNMPAGYALRHVSTPFSSGFGLSQRERLQSSSENAYRVALERMLRPRLIYRLEEQLDAKNIDPGFLYEALKVYMMLGGLHQADRELIKSWMRRDWAENLYPGASNAEGRKLLEQHLDAMLDLETGSPQIGLNGRLIDESQKALARLSIAQRAYELLKSQARTSTSGDWAAARKGGPDVARVFDAAGDPTLESVRVPEFFTYMGFQHDFIDQLGDITDRVKRDRWVLGTAGEQSALSEQYGNLPDDLLALYTRDFIETWRSVLNKLQLRKLTDDKPQYIALSAISAPTSPLTQLIESIRAETTVTRERASAAKPATAGGTANLTPKAPAAILFKAQDRAPGADIEDAFKPYQVLLEGDPPRRPIDDVVATLKEITQSLILAATTPSQTQRAIISLQDSVSKLRNSALRFPKPFSDMLLNFTGDVERAMALSSAGQLQVALRDQVTPVCLQTISNRYPFVRGSTNDAALADFAKLFGPGGVMDAFFKQYLDAHADRSKPQWTWRANSELAGTLSPDTLQTFQRASEIRDAFFQTGGNVPVVQLTVKPAFVSEGNVQLEIGGTVIASAMPSNAPQPASTPPVLVQWPGASLRAAISAAAGTGGPPSVLERTGPWSLFRLLEAGGLSVRGESATANFAVGGNVLRYDFTSAASRNPLNLAILRAFKCPSGI
jgi:type VI secretion system protein ImpL